MKFLGRSRWELFFVGEFNVNFNSHLDQPRNFIAPALCIHAYTKQPEGKSTQICPMNFKVCWDEHGYYINLTSKLRKIRTKGLHDYKLLPGTKTVGCPWHCCESNELMTKVSERKETVLQVNCSS